MVRGMQMSDEHFARLIYAAMRQSVNSLMERAKPVLIRKLQVAYQKALQQSPEVISLMSEDGQLRQELGIVNVHQVEIIIDALVSSINVLVEPARVTSGGTFVGSLTIYGMGLKTLNDVLPLPAASIKTDKGKVLHWLEWLALRGDETIIQGYEVTVGNSYERAVVSRTHSKVMRPRGAKKWGIPSQFTGTKGSNFITRAINTVDLDAVVAEVFKAVA